MSKKQVLCLEYNIFCRVLNHWEEFEEKSLPVVLNNILEEIDKELNAIAFEEFTLTHNYL
jgi:hypothetical protein